MATKKKQRTVKTASLKHERKYAAMGCRYIVGIDEVGRGPWAGPVTAAAVCLPLTEEKLSEKLKGVRDSKKMTANQRELLAAVIKEVALAWGIGSCSANEIDDLGIVPATQQAMIRALNDAQSRTKIKFDCLFLDDMILPEIRDISQVSMIEGDSRSLSIAAASVVAKVWRDDYMRDLDAEFPQYGFADHKGYGTAKHEAALRQYGVLPVHRHYYAPIRKLIEGKS